jgi:hypothetical protein
VVHLNLKNNSDMKWLTQRLFDYTGPVHFHSDHRLEESLRQIMKLIDEPRYDKNETFGFRSYLSGRASAGDVVLHRARPLVGNYFSKPIFYGSFVGHDGTVTLEGSFTISRLTKSLFLALLIHRKCGFERRM